MWQDPGWWVCGIDPLWHPVERYQMITTREQLPLEKFAGSSRPPLSSSEIWNVNSHSSVNYILPTHTPQPHLILKVFLEQLEPWLCLWRHTIAESFFWPPRNLIWQKTSVSEGTSQKVLLCAILWLPLLGKDSRKWRTCQGRVHGPPVHEQLLSSQSSGYHRDRDRADFSWILHQHLLLLEPCGSRCILGRPHQSLLQRRPQLCLSSLMYLESKYCATEPWMMLVSKLSRDNITSRRAAMLSSGVNCTSWCQVVRHGTCSLQVRAAFYSNGDGLDFILASHFSEALDKQGCHQAGVQPSWEKRSNSMLSH